MLQLVKVGMLAASVGLIMPPVAYAESKKSTAAAEDADTPHDRSFEETREFMKKHSEESKRTGKM